jgi:hypothetical protein
MWAYDPGASVSIGDIAAHVVTCEAREMTVRFPADQTNDYRIRQAHPRKAWLLIERIDKT